jgi:DNA-binding CsgD family transcriptional regulator
MTPDNTFTLSRLDRLILILFQLADAPKEIADKLERSESTINSHLCQIQRLAGLRNRAELLIWAMQTPACVERYGRCSPGLHKDRCECGAPLCASRLRAVA